MKNLLICIMSVLVLGSAIGCIPKRDVKVKSVADCERDVNPTTRAKCLIDLGVAKYKAGAQVMAMDMLSRASVACDEITDPSEKAQLLTELANGYSKIQDQFGSKNTLKKARLATEKLAEPETKAAELVKLANVQVNAGDMAGAAQTADSAVSQIQDDFLPDNKATILITAAEIYSKEGSTERRDELYAQLAAVADGLTDNQQKAAELYGKIAVSQTNLELKDEGKKNFDKAVSIADATEDLDQKGFAYFILAQMQWSLKDKDSAQALAKKAEDVVPKLSKKSSDRGAELDNQVTALKKEME